MTAFLPIEVVIKRLRNVISIIIKTPVFSRD